MASIVKRKSKYSVVYDYTDENGKRRQRWETFSTNAEAKKRKKQIEYEQDSGTFFIPTAKTLNDLLDEYMSIYPLPCLKSGVLLLFTHWRNAGPYLGLH